MNTTTTEVGWERARKGALVLLGLIIVSFVVASCGKASGPHSSSSPAIRTLGGAAAGVARLASTGAAAGGTAAPTGPHGAAVTDATLSTARAHALAAAVEPATDAAPAAATPLPVPLPGLAPPPSMSATCAQDVSAHMQHWLNNLPAGTVVRAPAGACYLVNEGLRLVGLHDITIIGGTWEDQTVPVANASPDDMHPLFWFVGGSGITVQNLFISGVNPGGYDTPGAFAAGIRSDGVNGFSATDVFVDHVYGDGVELTPLRGANDDSGKILRPSENVALHNVWIDGAGRQGVTLASVNGAALSGLVFIDIGFDVFDVEADQGNEGAQNVTIDGCRVRGTTGALFFANAGLGSGSPWTSNIQVEHCTMAAPLAGDAILIANAQSTGAQRGPITFSDDVLRCGSSVYVSCMEVSNGNLNVSNTFVHVPPGTVHEPIYHATHGSTVTLDNDVVTGYGTPGTADGSSSVTVQGGSWTASPGASPTSPPGSTTTTAATTTTTTATTSTTRPPHAVTTTTAPSRPATTTTTAPLLSSLSGSGSSSGSTKKKHRSS